MGVEPIFIFLNLSWDDKPKFSNVYGYKLLLVLVNNKLSISCA